MYLSCVITEIIELIYELGAYVTSNDLEQAIPFTSTVEV